MNATGNRGAFQQPGQWGRNEQGNFSVWRYHGSKREVYDAANFFAQTEGLNYQVMENYGTWVLEVHFPFSMNGIDPRTDKVDNWEFFAQHAEKDLLDSAVENPSSIGALTLQQIQKIRFFIANPPSGDTNNPFPTEQSFAKDTQGNPLPGVTDGGLNAFIIYQLEVQGVRNFPVEQPILRHTLITSDQYAITYALFNVRKLISTASLVTSESIPSGLLFNLPSDGSNFPTIRAYGWYKTFPTVQQIALLKWQIVQEYQYGLWATEIYGNPL